MKLIFKESFKLTLKSYIKNRHHVNITTIETIEKLLLYVFIVIQNPDITFKCDK